MRPTPDRLPLASLLLLLVTSLPAGVTLVLNDVTAPSYIVRGHSGHLRCDYDAAGRPIYAVKWYKDQVEFYRYKPDAPEPIATFASKGFVVNVARSNEHDLYLSQVDLDAAGWYKCEVTSGAPLFWTVEKRKKVQVVDMPDDLPSIKGHESSYRVGDVMKLNCSSYRSYPPVKLHWYVNEEPVSRVAWTSVESWTNPEPFSMSTTFSRLTHTVSPDDFNDGLMRVRCTASMNGTDYWESAEIAVSRVGRRQLYSPQTASSARPRRRLSLAQTLHILLAVFVMLLA
ncbi:uncharacterized protein LOC119103870 isoform X1 [Pollicipes pollicipes]|uniref:uncharacterized protein LOC119103870 isoform X1 n=1 Tax=Pollicipes pollicipes TaxID=41117 RepID=UPI001884B983|nr:uncharacterized protein LOC119103870 isoform X1 [Pollicipes pollicipes]